MVANPSSNKHKGSAFSLERKVAILLVLLLGVGGVVLGVRFMGTHLEQPLYDILYYSGPLGDYSSLEEQERRLHEEQKVSDTDEDGLTDYDELYVYKTSPYLADSDSDGINDKTEVITGDDPSCPSGRDCGYYFASDDDVLDESDTIPVVTSPIGASVGVDSIEDVAGILEGMSAEEIRQILIESGMDEAMIGAVDDETLVQLFNEAIADFQESEEAETVIQE
ncbi:MAG: hypothetical protein ABIH67_04185 [Candidatus Uhrbacteria bacterium]